MRLIDADALLTERKKSKYYHLPNGDIAIPIIDVEHAPTVKPKPQWIPCSERLPEENEAVLTQAQFKYDTKMAVSARVDFNYWTGWNTRDINIVAWMPLPEPYRGGEKE